MKSIQLKTRVLSILLILLFSIESQTQNRAPSLYLNYQDHFGGDIIINSLRVSENSPLYTYYCGMQWNGGLEAGGYCGMQEHPRGRNFIFSIWDPIDSPESITFDHALESTELANFGGEGTGLRSLDFGIGWETDVWYSLVARSWNGAESSTKFGFWVFDHGEEVWYHFVTMNFPVKDQYFRSSTGSFIEDWLGNGEKVRSVQHKDAWRRNRETLEWLPSTEAIFRRVTPDPGAANYIEQYDGGLTEKGEFFLSSGGDAIPSMELEGVKFSRKVETDKPDFQNGRIDNHEMSPKEDNEFEFTWSIDDQRAPQFQVMVNLKRAGELLESFTQEAPHLRKLTVDLSIYGNGKYEYSLSLIDLFDNKIESSDFELEITNSFVDGDGDGFSSEQDCDDNNPLVNKGMQEIPYNQIDDDCDPVTLDDDLDQDGFALATDCDDNNPQINSDAKEIQYNGIDDDCNPETLDDDLDQDGYKLEVDCDDNDPRINPGTEEVNYNGIDDDCNANTVDDDLDGDGFDLENDCNDNDETINPDAAEIVNNDIDENCDNLIEFVSAIETIEGHKAYVYPNPADNFLNIDLGVYIDLQAKIFDLNGKLLQENMTNHDHSINISKLNSGTYILELKSMRDDSEARFNFVKK